MAKQQSQDEKYHLMRERRDAAVREHLIQYAPLWIVDEKAIYEEDAIQFNAVFLHPMYGWTTRRYRFDSFNNTLYHMGQVMLDEEQALQVQLQAPYLEADVMNTVNSYGG